MTGAQQMAGPQLAERRGDAIGPMITEAYCLDRRGRQRCVSDDGRHGESVDMAPSRFAHLGMCAPAHVHRAPTHHPSIFVEFQILGETSAGYDNCSNHRSSEGRQINVTLTHTPTARTISLLGQGVPSRGGYGVTVCRESVRACSDGGSWRSAGRPCHSVRARTIKPPVAGSHAPCLGSRVYQARPPQLGSGRDIRNYTSPSHRGGSRAK